MDLLDVLLARAAEGAARARVLSVTAHGIADATRGVASRVQSTDGTAWRSVAADVFRQRTRELVLALRRAADEVDGTGDALRDHAGRAAARADHLAGLAHVVEQAARDGAEEVRSGAAEALERALSGPWYLP